MNYNEIEKYINDCKEKALAIKVTITFDLQTDLWEANQIYPEDL